MSGSSRIAGRPDALVRNVIGRTQPCFELDVGRHVRPQRQLIPPDPGVLMPPVVHPVRRRLQMAHFESGAIGPDPGGFTFLPMHPRKPRWIDHLASSNQFFQLRMGFAKENAVPMRAPRLGNILCEISQEEIALATCNGSSVEE